MTYSRRDFLARSAFATAALASVDHALQAAQPWLKISLQQYSFKAMLDKGDLTTPEYPAFAVEKCGIKALEYFNGFFMERAGDEAFFADLRKRCDDLGVKNQLMLCKNARALDDADSAIRTAAAKDYLPWLEASKALGMHSIRVDVRSPGDAAEVMKQAVDGLNQVCDIAAPLDVDIIVENHGNHSSNGKWVSDLMKAVDRDNCGTLPDFGNFKDYDKYQGVEDMLPWARAICAKVHEIDENGTAKDTDFERMLKIIKDGGFTGYIGIEFEGKERSLEGVLGTKKLIRKTLRKMEGE